MVNDDKLPQKRAIYIRNKRSAPVSMLQLFDQPDIETNCARRSQSTVPLQALSMMNSDLVSNAAVAFADRVRAEGGDDPIDFAFAAAFSRNPTADEKQILTEFLQAQIAIHEKSSGDRGQGQVAHKRQQVAVEAFEVQQGDLVYIVTDMNGELTSDNFLWSFRIQQVDKDGRLLRSWDSSGGFHGPISDSPADASASFKRALIDLCHVLLASNEFAYVD